MLHLSFIEINTRLLPFIEINTRSNSIVCDWIAFYVDILKRIVIFKNNHLKILIQIYLFFFHRCSTAVTFYRNSLLFSTISIIATLLERSMLLQSKLPSDAFVNFIRLFPRTSKSKLFWMIFVVSWNIYIYIY